MSKNMCKIASQIAKGQKLVGTQIYMTKWTLIYVNWEVCKGVDMQKGLS